MEGFSFVIDSANQCRWQGLDTGTTTPVSINTEVGILCLHIAGHKYWSGFGEQSYAPAKYEVFAIADVQELMGGTLTQFKCGQLLMEWPAEKKAWPGITVTPGEVVTQFETKTKHTDVKVGGSG